MSTTSSPSATADDFCPAVKTFLRALTYTEGGWGNHMGNVEYDSSISGNVKAPFQAVQWAAKDLARTIPDQFRTEAQRLKDYIDSYVETLGRFDYDLQTVVQNATPTEISFLAEWGSNQYFDDEAGTTLFPPEPFKTYVQDNCIARLGEEWWQES